MATDTADWYRRAATELRDHSPLHASWAAALADDPEVLAVVDRLPRPQRQPSLLFSVVGLLGGPSSSAEELREWMLRNADELVATARGRLTQTNEVGRCAPLLLALAALPGPIALIEVGASAGLCLLPDRYSYSFSGGPRLGEGDPLLTCTITGDALVPPTRLPHIVWRRGVDLAPLRADAPDDARWLESLIPPDRADRRARLRTAIATAARDAPRVDAGDALESLPGLVAEASRAAPTVVVASLGTLVYLAPEARARFLPLVRELGAHAVTLEAESALPEVTARLAGRTAPEAWPFLLAVDGHPLARCAPHGDRVSALSAVADRPA